MQPESPANVPGIEAQMTELGYTALADAEFDQRIANFYNYQTASKTNRLIMTLISFIVGLSISVQIFCTFIVENLQKFGALEASGANSRALISMLLLQALFTSLTSYGLGIGLCSLLIAVSRTHMPNYAAMITFTNLLLSFGMVLVNAPVSSYIGIRRVLRIDPFAKSSVADDATSRKS